MTDEFDRLLWAYRAVFTQTDVGGGNVKVTITANERTVILYGTIGPDDYAAGRAIFVRIIDDGGQTISTIMNNGAVDNHKFPFPVADHSVVTSSDGNEFEKRIVMGKGDALSLNAQALAQNETLTIIIRALMMSRPPTIITTGSTGTVTTTTTYDKVI